MINKAGKITVKHYLNKRAKSQVLNNIHYYPVYIQIIVAGQKAQIKSKALEFTVFYKGVLGKYINDKKIFDLVCTGYFSEQLFTSLFSQDKSLISSIYKDEIRILLAIIENLQPFRNKAFSLLQISKLYEAYICDIFETAQKAVKTLYLNELKRIFLESAKNPEQRKLFKVSNYFMHFINWENNFADYYETTYEVLPSEIRFIENHFSEELKTQLKAIMAFHSREKYVKRFLDKYEKGLFPVILYLDWQEEVKDFITKDFIKTFGRQKALEYVQVIDRILYKEVNVLNAL
jgi:hypothetical protein